MTESSFKRSECMALASECVVVLKACPLFFYPMKVICDDQQDWNMTLPGVCYFLALEIAAVTNLA